MTRTGVMTAVEDARLIPRDWSLKGVLHAVLEYVRRRKIEAVEGSTELNAATQLPVVSGKITFREPSQAQSDLGFMSVDTLANKANDALASAGVTVWILLDRLDVAFAEASDLESMALRGLFRTYLDFQNLNRVRLKLFLRTDIWKSIVEGGFREGSHITRQLTIEWSPQSLMDLVVRRILHNEPIRNYYGVNADATIADKRKQADLFYIIFPRQVDKGKNPDTFGWMLSRTADGTGRNAPRELIHLMNQAREEQVRLLETGSAEPGNGLLFEPAALRNAMREVSRVRFEQTFALEYPTLAGWARALRNKKSDQTIDTLKQIWDVDRDEARTRTRQLVDAGFFKEPKRNGHTYSIPFLYRPALSIVQGVESASSSPRE